MFDAKQSIQIAEFILSHPHIRTAPLVDWAHDHHILKYTSRISEARKLGYVIQAKRISRRESEYTVSARPGDSQLSI